MNFYFISSKVDCMEFSYGILVVYNASMRRRLSKGLNLCPMGSFWFVSIRYVQFNPNHISLFCICLKDFYIILQKINLHWTLISMFCLQTLEQRTSLCCMTTLCMYGSLRRCTFYLWLWLGRALWRTALRTLSLDFLWSTMVY